MAYIAGYRTYLTQVQARTAALKREGKTIDQPIATVTAELKDDYPETGPMAGAIRASCAEAD